MSANEKNLGRDDTRPLPVGALVSSYGPTRFSSSQSLALYVIVAAGTITALLVLNSILSQMGPLRTDGFGRAITAAGLAGILAGMFSYAAVQLFNQLINSGLCQILAGEKLPSASWGALALLGIAIGGSIALIHALAIAVLPVLPAYPML